MRLTALIPAICLSVMLVGSCSHSENEANLPWKIRKNGSGFEFQWNRETPELSKHRSVVLVLEDGAKRSELALDRARGTLFYSPESPYFACALRLSPEDGGKDELLSLYGKTRTEPVPEVKEPAQPVQTTAVEDDFLAPRTIAVSIFRPGQRERRIWTRTQAAPGPVLPDVLREKLGGRIVEVVVYIKINETGSVSAASTPVSPDALERELADIATKAAFKWRFDPVRVNGQRVYGDAQLRFRFPRNTRA